MNFTYLIRSLSFDIWNLFLALQSCQLLICQAIKFLECVLIIVVLPTQILKVLHLTLPVNLIEMILILTCDFWNVYFALQFCKLRFFKPVIY